MKRKLFNYSFLLTVLVLALALGGGLKLHYHQIDQMKLNDLKLMLTFENERLFADDVHIFVVTNTGELSPWVDHREMPQENFLDWPEVQEALRTGEGSGKRAILGESHKSYIHAHMLQSEEAVIVVTMPAESGLVLGARLFWLILGLLVLAGILSYLFADRVTRSIIEPLNDAGLEDLEGRDICEELRPMASRMLDQSRQMQRQLQRQNIEVRREYEKQDRMRRDFTANVSHELKTPLTSISGYAEIIRDGIVRPEDVGRFAGKIYDEAQRMIVLVGDILKLSQLDEGHQIQTERVPVDLYEVCERVIARLQAPAEARGIAFTLMGEHLSIIGSEQIVEEIAYNLCDNAIKYNREQGEIAVSVHRQEDMVALSVRDSGIGISEEEQARVFERFYRVDKSHSKEIGGTGLGLSIVKHGAAYHDARIELESRLGEGTEFRVLFSLNAAQPFTEETE